MNYFSRNRWLIGVFLPILLMSAVLLVTSCRKEVIIDSIKFENERVEKVDDFTGIFTYDIVLSGNPFVLEKGYIASVENNPTIFNQKILDTLDFTSLSRNFTFRINTDCTYYFIRPYAITNYDTVYGKIVEFETGSYFIEGNGVTDNSGYQYRTVKIGNLEWMAENLCSENFCNGDAINYVPDLTALTNSNASGYSYSNYDSSLDTVFGKLYNVYAVADSRNICPCGWRIPSEVDVYNTFVYIGYDDIVGGKLKATGTLQENNGKWKFPNAGANNRSGLSVLPAGYLTGYPNFNGTFEEAQLYFTRLSESNPSQKYRKIGMYYTTNQFDVYYSNDFRFMASVRCVRDI